MLRDDPAERRRQRRVSFKARVRDCEGDLFILDISESGLRLLGDFEPQTETIELELELGDRRHDCLCQVVWSKRVARSGQFQVGLRFERVEPSLEGAFEEKVPTLGRKDRGALRDLSDAELGRLELLARISSILNESHDSDDLLARVMNVAVHYLNAERGLLIVPQGEEFSVSIHAGDKESNFSRRVVQQVMESLEPLLSLDATDDIRLEDSQSIKLMGTRSILCAPILSAQRCLGLIYLDNSITTNAFTQPELHIATIIADMAASAMERADFVDFLSKSQRDLAAAHEELHSLVERNPDGILMIGPDRKIRFSNPAAEHFLDIEKLADTLELSGNQTQAIEVDICRHDGKSGRAEVKVEGAVWGEKPAYLVTLHDVTGLREKEEQLRHSQRMQAIGRLAGGIAHDFNNLLTAILGSCELLNVTTEANLTEQESIRSCAERAASLTRQLLTFSKERLRKARTLDLKDTVAKVQTMLVRVLGEDISLKIHAPEEPLFIFSDEDEIGQILLNLAINSRDAMPSGGFITIAMGKAEREGQDFARLRISDNGPGIEESIRQRIFEPFFTTKSQGTGLGLATVYGIVESCEGHISVQSFPGRGTDFTILLPLTDAFPERSAPKNESSLAQGTERILLVEDEPSVRKFMVRVLAKAGYQVDDYECAEDALEAELNLESYSLVLSDVMLPGMTGLDLVESLLKRKPDLKVLLVSGYSEDILKRRGSSLRDFPFLHKPFGVKELASTLKQILSEETKLDASLVKPTES